MKRKLVIYSMMAFTSLLAIASCGGGSSSASSIDESSASSVSESYSAKIGDGSSDIVVKEDGSFLLPVTILRDGSSSGVSQEYTFTYRSSKTLKEEPAKTEGGLLFHVDTSYVGSFTLSVSIGFGDGQTATADFDVHRLGNVSDIQAYSVGEFLNLGETVTIRTSALTDDMLMAKNDIEIKEMEGFALEGEAVDHLNERTFTLKSVARGKHQIVLASSSLPALTKTITKTVYETTDAYTLDSLGEYEIKGTAKATFSIPYSFPDAYMLPNKDVTVNVDSHGLPKPSISTRFNTGENVLLLDFLVEADGTYDVEIVMTETNATKASFSVTCVGVIDTFEQYKGAQTINVWAPLREKPVMATLVNEYNSLASEADRVNVNFVSLDENDAAKAFAENPRGEDHPSLVALTDESLSELADKGYAAPVLNTYASAVKEGNVGASVTAVSRNDTLYGYPTSAESTYFLYYNGDMLSETDVSTLEGILAKCQEKEKGLMYDLSAWKAAGFFLSEGVCGPNSISFHKNDQDKVIYDLTWDNEEAATAMEYLSSLVKENRPAGIWKENDSSGDELVRGFKDGSIIAAVSGLWLQSTLEGVCSNLKAVKLPTFSDGNGTHQIGSFSYARAFVVNATATVAEQKAAHTIANLITAKEAQLKRFAINGSLPCNKEALKDDAYLSKVDYARKASTDQVQYAAAQYTSIETRYWDVGDTIGNALRTGEIGELTWKEYLKQQCDILRS